jgi:hypothetical protein
MAHYSTPAQLQLRTGIGPRDLGLGTQQELDGVLTELLEQVSDLANRVMRRDWLAELDAGLVAEIPAGLHATVADMAATALREMIATRQTPVVRIDDFAVRTLPSRLLTEDVRQRLRLYAAGGGAASADIALPDVVGSDWSWDLA